MELIRDIANELDIDVLCHKILVNVQLLTHADRGSLFLVKGNSTQSRYLHAKLFDVTQDTGKRWDYDMGRNVVGDVAHKNILGRRFFLLLQRILMDILFLNENEFKIWKF